MSHDKKEDALVFFSITLTLVAASVLVYMVRDPTITGNVALEAGSVSTTGVVSVLILATISLVVGAILSVHSLKKEIHEHKMALAPDNVDEYIKKAKEKGFSDKEILERLEKSDWNEKEIKKHL